MNRIGRTIICSFALITAASSTVFGDDLTITSFSGFAGQTNILLQATGDITFSGGLMNLPALPPGASSGLLTVEAGNDIIVEDGTSILAGQGWSVSLQAGNSLNVAGTGSINSAGDVTIRTGGMLPGGSTTIWSGTPNPGGTITIQPGDQGGIVVVDSGPAIPVGTPSQIILLNSQINGPNITALAGTNVLFIFIADNNAPLDVQWFKNGRRLHGETNAVLSLMDIRPSDAGCYSVVVSNPGGRVRSSVNLRVLQPPHPGRCGGFDVERRGRLAVDRFWRPCGVRP